MTDEGDVQRVLEKLREAPLFMPYVHYSVSFYELCKALGDEDRTRWALHVLCTRGKAQYETHCSPDHYSAFAELPAPFWSESDVR